MMTVNKQVWEENLNKYDKLVKQCPRFERKGKSVPNTAANGYMFSMLNKDGELGIRFGKERQKELIEELGTGLFHSYGSVMRGYVHIPQGLWKDTKKLVQLLNESFDYVMSLDPK